MIYTTLNRIREHAPSADVWCKLLTHLGKTAADDEPLAYSAILDAVGLDDALWCLRAEPQHANIWRMYAVRAARSVQHLMGDERSLRALDVAERHARGAAEDSELVDARAAAWVAACSAAWAAVGAVAMYAALAAAKAAALAAARGAARDAALAAAWVTGDAAWDAARAAARNAALAAAWGTARDAARERMAADFRALLASHEALPGESCALNEWGADEFAALRERLEKGMEQKA